MMTGPENWRTAYPAFLGGMVIIGALNYWLIKWAERGYRTVPSFCSVDSEEPQPPR